MKISQATINQIESCPRGTLYVCPSDTRAFLIRDTAVGLGRTEIRFMGPEVLDNPYNYTQCSFATVVVDNEVELTRERREGFVKLLSAVSPGVVLKNLPDSVTGAVVKAQKPPSKISVTVGINTNDYAAEEYAVGPDGTLVLTAGGKEVYRFAAYCWQAVGYSQS